jgi:tetratricopeptide (TPR) repeat protein
MKILLLLLSVSALAKAPNNLAYQNYSKGVELSAKKKWDDALEKFQAAIDLNPGYLASYVEWARAAVMIGRRRDGLEKLSASLAYARSKEEKERVLRERDSLSDIFYTNETFQQYQNGLNYQRLERPGSAVEALEKALKTEPDNVAVLLAYGRALQSEDRKKEALSAFERAIVLNDGNRDVRMDLAEALLPSNPERSIQLLKIMLEPLEERVAWIHSQALSSLEDNKEAIEFLRSAFESHPTWVYAPYWLGKLYSLEKGGGWNARKYLMTFLKRTEKAADLTNNDPTPEQKKLRTARTEADAILTRVNRALE